MPVYVHGYRSALKRTRGSTVGYVGAGVAAFVVGQFVGGGIFAAMLGVLALQPALLMTLFEAAVYVVMQFLGGEPTWPLQKG